MKPVPLHSNKIPVLKKGYTIIESLVVLGVLGIISIIILGLIKYHLKHDEPVFPQDEDPSALYLEPSPSCLTASV